MDKAFWHARWRNGQIGFHSPTPHWALARHWHRLELGADQRVLVPLCGKSLDMHWLRRHGHRVDGVEIDPIAVREFFAEWQAPAQTAAPRAGEGFLEADGIRVWNVDFFDYLPDRPAMAFYDRAALIALPTDMRKAYMSHLRRCLRPEAVGILITLEYDQLQKDGPPFSVSHQELMGYEGFEVEVLEHRDVLGESPKFRESGVTALRETAYWLTAV